MNVTLSFYLPENQVPLNSAQKYAAGLVCASQLHRYLSETFPCEAFDRLTLDQLALLDILEDQIQAGWLEENMHLSSEMGLALQYMQTALTVWENSLLTVSCGCPADGSVCWELYLEADHPGFKQLSAYARKIWSFCSQFPLFAALWVRFTYLDREQPEFSCPITADWETALTGFESLCHKQVNGWLR